MPVKRRVAKRRLTAAAEVAVWGEVFADGVNWFDDLSAVDVTGDPWFAGPVDATAPAWHQERTAEANAALGAAREAWGRLGGLFLSSWRPRPHRATPWALEAFGEPQGDHAHGN